MYYVVPGNASCRALLSLRTLSVVVPGMHNVDDVQYPTHT